MASISSCVVNLNKLPKEVVGALSLREIQGWAELGSVQSDLAVDVPAC